jgi:flagellar motor switch protein FliN/FliY
VPEETNENLENADAQTEADAGAINNTDAALNDINTENGGPESPEQIPSEEASADPPLTDDSAADGTPEIDEITEQVAPLPDFSNMLADAAASSIEMLNDVDLDVKIELGRTELTVEEILQLTEGSVVELDKLAGDPVDILVNEQLIARGEVLVVNDNFCVRINEIFSGVK